MTREELIDVIYNRADKSNCPIYCPEYTRKYNCTKCAEKQLTEYEKQIKAETIDECIETLYEVTPNTVDQKLDMVFVNALRQLKGE